MKNFSDTVNEKKSNVVFSLYNDDDTLYKFFYKKEDAEKEMTKLNNINSDFPLKLKKENISEFE